VRANAFPRFPLNWRANVSSPKILPTPGDAANSSDPNGALSVFDAVNKQLGLKLEKTKRSYPVLVIDHIEETPTEN
jgi:uncharacterized protein (TIGR03435 family)